ncbi:heavy metal-associated isoprenylated plant protein 9 [Cajanus cajan]|uniref:heavy metal-associated isoprenylated plant protein 9 n=1 Tax=Cajanus cajan TaxID=3821 RepID=UPI00098DCF24|nr:heavy metal-associated isoprenylated plant protein 9 [Cajanus cajan]
MGEEAKQEPPKGESMSEENPEDEKKEEKPVEEKKEPKPPSLCVLFVELHCVGCAKKIKRSIMKMRGVEGVVIDMAKNEVTIKGIVEPQAICNIITKKAMKKAQVISPLPEAEGEPIPEVVTSQASEPVTVELNVNMHCVACAEQLKRKILKMRGVQRTVTEFSPGKVTVTGTMDANKLVEYVYRRTKKQVKIVPQPEPEKKEENNEFEKPVAEEAKAEEEKEENAEKKEEEKPEEEAEIEEGDINENENEEEKSVEEEAKKEVGGGDENGMVLKVDDETESMEKVMYYNHYQPLYVIERIPPPQLFSDENPNACCIS